MKTSAVLGSLLFGSLAVAAPFDKRALVYKTEVVTETVVVFTTVYEDDVVPQATTTPAGYFYEKPNAPSSADVKPTPAAQAPAYTPPAVPEQKPTSIYVAPAPEAPAATPSPSPAPAPVVDKPNPVVSPEPAPAPPAAPSSAAYVAPAPAASSAAPAAPSTPSKPVAGGDSTTGQYSGDITIYEPAGATGACGKALQDSEFVVALSKDAWGASTYDTMTGEATNKWCGQKITAYFQGRSVSATIMDMCPGCKGDDIDLSPAAWKELTGSDEKTRYKATWSKA